MRETQPRISILLNYLIIFIVLAVLVTVLVMFMQESDYDDYNQFPADTVENDLDRRTLISQENNDDTGRTLKLPISAPSGITTDLPIPVSDTLIGWNTSGDGIENKVPATLDFISVDTTTTLGTSDAKVPSQNAVKVYTDTKFASVTSVTLTLATSAEASAGTEATHYITPSLATIAIASLAPVETAWTDYSATSTIVGWASFTTKEIYKKKIGKLTFIQWNIVGVSNSASTSFTTGETPVGPTTTSVSQYAVDNGGAPAHGLANAQPTGNGTVALYKDIAGSNFTATGDKTCRGQMFWVTA